MTITQVLDRVPWGRMSVRYGCIREHAEPWCPLQVAFTKRDYVQEAQRQGVAFHDVLDIMKAADSWDRPILRLRMLWRMWRAR